MNLLEQYVLGSLSLPNRIVMAPMTRGRAENKDLIPSPIMAEYYKQRATAGLIISEGTWVSPESIGFINVPGIYTEAQIDGWRFVTQSVHTAGGKIFLQLGHVGGVSHADLLNGARPKAPSAIDLLENVFTPSGFKKTQLPLELTYKEILKIILDYKQAAINAKKAGFDGIEIHGAHVFLIPQFLSSETNKRTDEYGMTAENRSRFLLDLIDELSKVWDSERIGIKLSPATKSGAIKFNEDTEETYAYIAKELSKRNLAYLHLLGPQYDVTGAPEEIYKDIAAYFRPLYKGTLIVGGGFTKESGEKTISDGKADLIAFGTPFIANPDLPEIFGQNLPISLPEQATFYAGGANGYIDYPSKSKTGRTILG